MDKNKGRQKERLKKWGQIRTLFNCRKIWKDKLVNQLKVTFIFRWFSPEIKYENQVNKTILTNACRSAVVIKNIEQQFSDPSAQYSLQFEI